MKRYILFLGLISLLFSSCRKEEEGYDYLVSQDLSRFLVVTTPGINMALELRDSLINGDTLRYRGEVTYISGDASNPENPSTELIYRINYYTGVQDFDDRHRAGSVYIHFYPGSSEYLMSVGYDSLITENYNGDGVINLAETEEGSLNGEYSMVIKNFYLKGAVGETTTSARAYVSRISNGDLSIRFEKERGEASDGREFKFLSSGDITWGNNCQNFTGGEVLVKPKTYAWRSLKFGYGSCGGTARAESGSVIQGFPLL